MRRVPVGLAVLSAAVMIGCQGASRADQPPRIRYGEASCANCRMLISEAHLAAAFSSVSGEVSVFDEIGCLLRALARSERPAAHVWVHDYASGEWIEAANASFVQSDQVTTPMGSGLVAFAAREQADEFARLRQGRVLRFNALTALSKAG